jgi:hypothetical protein
MRSGADPSGKARVARPLPYVLRATTWVKVFGLSERRDHEADDRCIPRLTGPIALVQAFLCPVCERCAAGTTLCLFGLAQPFVPEVIGTFDTDGEV